MLARIDEFARVEDNDVAANRDDYKRDRRQDRRHAGSSEKNKKENRSGSDSNSGLEAYNRVNTIYNRPIHKIIFDIQGQPFFKLPKPMDENFSSLEPKLRFLYHKDHGHKMENCRTLKQFLKKLVEQGHLAEYMKPAGKNAY